MKNGTLGGEADLMSQPRVGIFWVVEDQLIIDSVPVSEASEIDGKRDHDASHWNHWERVCDSQKNLSQFSYDHFPRGRVIYDAKADRFNIFADKCILKNTYTLGRLHHAMHLPESKTRPNSDAHYRCHKCDSKFISDIDLAEI